MKRIFIWASFPLTFLIITHRASAQGIDTIKWGAPPILPLKQLHITSPFGYRRHPITGKIQFHTGADLTAHNDTVYSILDGIVNRIASNPLSGIFIIIDHDAGIQSIYAHLSGIAVLPGENVTAGQVIGKTGETGMVTGPHLHFAIKYQGQFIPPIRFLYQSNYK